jgi:hypothetical protein
MATFAVTHIVGGSLQGTRQGHRAGAIMLQQVKGHARGRLYADSRQAAQGLDQGVE